MIQPYYAVEGVASFWTTTESQRWVLSRAIIWLLVLWYEHWPRFHIFNFQIPIPHSPFFVLAVSISHTAPLGVALQLLIQYPFLLFYCEVIFTIKKYAKIIEKKFCKKTSWACYAEIAPVLVDHFSKGFRFQMTFALLKEVPA